MKSIVVFIVAVLLFVPLSIIGFIWAVVESFVNRNFKGAWKKVTRFFWTSALSLDQTGNVICQELFNDALIKPNGYRFGNPDETISSVIGKNKLKNTLTVAGKVLDWVLDKLDPNHSIKSIEEV